ncbi:hypothetical protein CY0110_15867 [Crocosphaera chwakensis CCY0110]|uniref:Uncharacterized protein n=1 Tax=Crocosphaera chwakensis CCY0110 TaxID=391612 RepID=A3IHK5_9CHRO|nr:hypothetical protein CY0110_15867 [Crocosphaera chwakensis CCY0110]
MANGGNVININTQCEQCCVSLLF